MEIEVKQRNQRNRRRERAQRMQAQRESKVKDGDSGEDESPAREKPPRPPARRKKSREPLGEEDIIDGFAIMAFRTYEDLEVRTSAFATPSPGPVVLISYPSTKRNNGQYTTAFVYQDPISNFSWSTYSLELSLNVYINQSCRGIFCLVSI